MKKITVISQVLMLCVVLLIHRAAISQTSDALWIDGYGQGNLEYFVNKNDVQLYISCPTKDGSANALSSVSVTENGRQVNAFQLKVGGIQYDGPFKADSRVGDNNFLSLIESLRQYDVTILFSNKKIVIPKSNAAEVLPSTRSSDFTCNLFFNTDVAQNFNSGVGGATQPQQESRSNKKNDTTANPPQLQIEPNVEYEFWGRNNRCTDQPARSLALRSKCVSEQVAKQLCESAKGFATRVRRHISIGWSGATQDFIAEGGSFEDGRIWWSNNRCNGSFRIRGILNGTSTVRTFEGIVGGFVLSSDGKDILAWSFVLR